MKKLVLFLSLMVSVIGFSQSSSSLPSEIYGIWRSVDNEFVSIYVDEEFRTVFERRSSGGQRLAIGTISYNENGEMCITRFDIKDQYSLAFIIGPSTLVITKPRSDRAWLWSKIQ